MKKLVFVFLFMIISQVSFSQIEKLKPADMNYILHRTKNLKIEGVFYEYNGVAYSNGKLGFLFETDSARYEVFPLKKVYPSDKNSVNLVCASYSEYIVFRNIETNKFDRVIDLRPIMENVEYKEILTGIVMKPDSSRHLQLSITITKDGKRLFFSTASNTFDYNLVTDTWSEIDVRDKNLGIVYTLSNLNNITEGNILLFNVRTFVMTNRPGHHNTEVIRGQYGEYDYVTKKFNCNH